MSDLNEMSTQLEQLAESVGTLEVQKLDGTEPLDQDLIDWYEGRFKMLKEDGVPNAITYYMEKVQRSNANDLTKATIINKALEYC